MSEKQDLETVERYINQFENEAIKNPRTMIMDQWHFRNWIQKKLDSLSKCDQCDQVCGSEFSTCWECDEHFCGNCAETQTLYKDFKTKYDSDDYRLFTCNSCIECQISKLKS